MKHGWFLSPQIQDAKHNVRASIVRTCFWMRLHAFGQKRAGKHSRKVSRLSQSYTLSQSLSHVRKSEASVNLTCESSECRRSARRKRPVKSSQVDLSGPTLREESQRALQGHNDHSSFNKTREDETSGETNQRQAGDPPGITSDRVHQRQHKHKCKKMVELVKTSQLASLRPDMSSSWRRLIACVRLSSLLGDNLPGEDTITPVNTTCIWFLGHLHLHWSCLCMRECSL